MIKHRRLSRSLLDYRFILKTCFLNLILVFGFDLSVEFKFLR